MGIMFFERMTWRLTCSIYILMLSLILTAAKTLPKINLPGDAREAVSYGSFSGVGPSRTSILFALLTLIGATIGLIQFLIESRFLRTEIKVSHQPTFSLRSPSETHSLNHSKLFLRFFVILVTCPFFEGVLPSLRKVSTGIDFDSQQISAWFDFAAQGKTPMKDFWFPYNGMMIFQDGLLGYILIWLSLMTTGFMLISLQHINNMYKERFLFFIMVMILMSNYQVIAVRYFFPLVALLYLIHQWRIQAFSPLRSVPFAMSIWMSPEVSAFLFVFFLFAWAVITYKLWSLRCKHLLLMVQTVFIVSVSLIIQTLTLIRRGALENTLQLLLKPLESIQLGFSPILGLNFELSVDKTQIFRMAIYSTVLILWAHSISRFLSNYKSQKIDHISRSLQLLLVSSFGMTLLQKEMVRGGLTLWIASILTLSLAVLIPELLFPKLNYVKSIIFRNFKFSLDLLKLQILTGFALLAFATPVAAGSSTQVFRSPQQFKFLLTQMYSTDISQVFLHSNWSLAGEEIRKNIENEIGIRYAKTVQNDFFVLGDRPDFYRGLSENPYWIMSTYNMSPIREQKRILNEISLRNPTYVIVDKRQQALTFDGISTQVRLYSLYQYLIPRYTPLAQFDSIDILKLSTSGPNLRYWSNLLGTDVNLGYLPSAATVPVEGCDSDVNARCGLFLKVTPKLEGDFQVRATCPKSEFTISFMKKSSAEPNWISLDRLWFWSDECSVNLPNGFSLTKLKRGQYLY